jgi:hypothetical protein
MKERRGGISSASLVAFSQLYEGRKGRNRYSIRVAFSLLYEGKKERNTVSTIITCRF